MLKLPSEILKMLQIPKNKLNECIEPFFLANWWNSTILFILKWLHSPDLVIYIQRLFFLIDSKESWEIQAQVDFYTVTIPIFATWVPLNTA